MTMNIPLRREDVSDMTGVRTSPGAVSKGATRVEIGLSAAIVSVCRDEPMIMCVPTNVDGALVDVLPSGPFSPTEHRTLDTGLRTWVAEQTDLDLGYVEQLYTFGDRGRHAQPFDQTPHTVSIGYLALTRQPLESDDAQDGAVWKSWYDFFPWEDWRQKGRLPLTPVFP
ncbi:MAG: NAD regulator, partial [Pseudomonadota bacterium]